QHMFQRMRKVSPWGNHSARMIAGTLVLVFCVVNSVAQDTHVSLESQPFWLWTFLGRLHPLVVHFPVGLIVFAAIIELFTLRRFDSPLRPGIRVSILAGVLFSIPAIIFGLLLAKEGDYGGD